MTYWKNTTCLIPFVNSSIQFSAAQDKAEEMAAYQAHMDMEKERLAIVEEERQKLIQKHAEKLFGFLPRVRTYSFRYD